MKTGFNSSVAVTQNIKVKVHSKYDPGASNLQEGQYCYIYHVSIQNKGTTPVTLMNRYWHITDGLGRVQEVKGEGVIGQRPTLQPGDLHEYSSFCPLETQFGVMKGHYEMVTDRGEKFIVEVAPFKLSVPHALN
ncbi:MAG: Co2+/Mg2+ efflux protein ApaG [Candidatus Marinimicrobia bacterium]|nr:Co2+/Mg2+ efflux protein ApaG [Candidatus Neomarinimicrobiota bacterium]|tara:strand:- start:861 stop:1262 length:402 start_codon:yes stop_codon:yes gene_type:complete